MTKKLNWGPVLIVLPMLWLCGAVCLVGCDTLMYPTDKEVKALAVLENEHRTDLQNATVEVMTEQHTAMTPELEAVFAALLVQNQELSASLKKLAADRVAAVKGPQIGSLGDALGGGLVPQLMSMFGLGALIPIYNMFFGKSRAQKELDAINMKLAVAAPAGEAFPGEKK